MPRTSPFSSSVFHTASTLSGSLSSPPSPRGEGFVRRYSFSTYACIRSDNARKAAFSYRSLPHWGRGTAQRRSGALVNDALVTIFPDLFHPASPSNLRPFGAPPSIGRRECPREPLPLEGAAERSEAGLASFFAAKPPPLCLPHAGKALCRGQRHSHKCRASILRKQKPLCEDGLCRAVSGSIILRSRILRDFSAYPHHFLS